MNEKDVVDAVKDPSSFSWMAYLWVVILSIWGGVVSYVRKVQKGTIHKWSLTELLGELVVSSFAGMLTFLICEWANLPPLLTAAFVGISGHMGSRGIFLLEKYFKDKFGKLV